jgi:hypothetical protein
MAAEAPLQTDKLPLEEQIVNRERYLIREQMRRPPTSKGGRDLERGTLYQDDVRRAILTALKHEHRCTEHGEGGDDKGLPT